MARDSRQTAGRGRILREGLVLGEALRCSREGLTYAEVQELLGCRYRTALRWADAAEAAGIAERWEGEDGRTLLRWRRTRRET